MVKKFLFCVLLVVSSCSRGEEFYRKKCVYHSYKDEDRGEYCGSVHLIKVDPKPEVKKPEQKVVSSASTTTESESYY